MDDLKRLGGRLGDLLAAATLDGDGDAFRFDTSSAPVLPPAATSDRVVITRSHHTYNGCWRADSLHLYATKQTLRALGVLALASLFGRTTVLALTHPASHIRTLRINTPPGPAWYDYRPRRRMKYPLAGDEVDPHDLPAVHLTAQPSPFTDAEWAARDTIVGFGTAQGVARFGQLLLDAGHPDGELDEYHLEGEAGNRGVAPLSAELNLWLPGSIAWEPDLYAGYAPEVTL
ncbi:MAG TPA: hypothetical protein VF062_14520 [Candidatus Limnocylindrales bacterium]